MALAIFFDFIKFKFLKYEWDTDAKSGNFPGIIVLYKKICYNAYNNRFCEVLK